MSLLRSVAGVAFVAIPVSVTSFASGNAAAGRQQQTGQQIFESVCSPCHTVQPPAKLAPPMSHVARHYLEKIPDRDAALARIEAWVLQPAADRSLLPSHALEMWGLMPPLGVQPEQARAVAAYVLTLADSARSGGMAGRGGMMHGMMGGDTAMAGHMGMGRGTMMHRDSAGTMRRMGRGMGMGRGMMMHHDSAGTMQGMGMGRGAIRRDTTDTTAVRHRHRGG